MIMEILPYFWDLDTGPSVKAEFANKLDQELGKDYFMYSCWEEEITQQTMEDAYQKSLRWPPLHREGSSAPEEAKDLTALFQWYQATYPVFSLETPLVYGHLADFLAPFIYMLFDVKLVLTAQNPAQARGELQPDVLNPILDQLEATFPTHGAMMRAYLTWSLRKTEKETYDLASFPPVGRYAKILRRFQGRGNPSSAPYASRDRDPSRDRKAPPRRDRAEEAAIEAALAEVEQAIQTLLGEHAPQELALVPQNSFIRRLQHQRAIDKGFTSRSHGDGDDRTVVVQQKKKEDV
jgi:hypothetical protein